jgi:WD40 repeat protein
MDVSFSRFLCSRSCRGSYGYRGYQCRNNVHLLKDGSVAYFIAGVGVILQPNGERTQKFFRGHNDDIIWWVPRKHVCLPTCSSFGFCWATVRFAIDPATMLPHNRPCSHGGPPPHHSSIQRKKGLELITHSLALHPDQTTLASGQVGDNPVICVWDSSTLKTCSILQGRHKDGVAAVSFGGPDGKV